MGLYMRRKKGSSIKSALVIEARIRKNSQTKHNEFTEHFESGNTMGPPFQDPPI